MPQYNNSVLNISKILSLFSQARPRWGISEISRELKLSSTTTFNLVNTLAKIDFLAKNRETQKYELGVRIASIGSIMVSTMELNMKGSSVVLELSASYDLDCRMGIWDRGTILVIFNGFPINVQQPPSYQAGPRVPGYATAMGRAILSHMKIDEVKKYLDRINLVKFTTRTKVSKSEILKELDETKKRGYSICNEEMVFGFAALGAAIVDGESQAIGAIAFVGEAKNIMGPEMENYANALCSRAQQIAQNMGYGF